MAYIGSLVQSSLGANGSRLAVQNCSAPLAQYIERRVQAVLAKLTAAQTQLGSGGKAVRHVLKDNFLDDSDWMRQQVLAVVDRATLEAGRVLRREITIECSEAANCCDGAHPACLMPDRGLDRIIVCTPTFRAQGGVTQQEQILLHELVHRAGLRGQYMHAVQFADIDCARKGVENKALRKLADGGTKLLEVVDLHVRVVWCLAALAGV